MKVDDDLMRVLSELLGDRLTKDGKVEKAFIEARILNFDDFVDSEPSYFDEVKVKLTSTQKRSIAYAINYAKYLISEGDSLLKIPPSMNRKDFMHWWRHKSKQFLQKMEIDPSFCYNQSLNVHPIDRQSNRYPIPITPIPISNTKPVHVTSVIAKNKSSIGASYSVVTKDRPSIDSIPISSNVSKKQKQRFPKPQVSSAISTGKYENNANKSVDKCAEVRNSNYSSGVEEVSETNITDFRPTENKNMEYATEIDNYLQCAARNERTYGNNLKNSMETYTTNSNIIQDLANNASSTPKVNGNIESDNYAPDNSTYDPTSKNECYTSKNDVINTRKYATSSKTSFDKYAEKGKPDYTLEVEEVSGITNTDFCTIEGNKYNHTPRNQRTYGNTLKNSMEMNNTNSNFIHDLDSYANDTSKTNGNIQSDNYAQEINTYGPTTENKSIVSKNEVFNTTTYASNITNSSESTIRHATNLKASSERVLHELRHYFIKMNSQVLNAYNTECSTAISGTNYKNITDLEVKYSVYNGRHKTTYCHTGHKESNYTENHAINKLSYATKFKKPTEIIKYVQREEIVKPLKLVQDATIIPSHIFLSLSRLHARSILLQHLHPNESPPAEPPPTPV